MPLHEENTSKRKRREEERPLSPHSGLKLVPALFHQYFPVY
jgi:hypothetical protein